MSIITGFLYHGLAGGNDLMKVKGDWNNEYSKKDRREILERNECPNCKKKMSLIISEKTPCPKSQVTEKVNY